MKSFCHIHLSSVWPGDMSAFLLLDKHTPGIITVSRVPKPSSKQVKCLEEVDGIQRASTRQQLPQKWRKVESPLT